MDSELVNKLFSEIETLSLSASQAASGGDFGLASSLYEKAAKKQKDLAFAGDGFSRESRLSYANELHKTALSYQGLTSEKQTKKKKDRPLDISQSASRRLTDDDLEDIPLEMRNRLVLPVPEPKNDCSFSSIAGLDKAKESLKDSIALFRDKKGATKYGLSPASRILLYGPSGTGKTMFARAVANELGAPLFYGEIAKLKGDLVGHYENNLKLLFRAARKYPISVVFFDEIEAIGSERNRNGGDYTQPLLTEMDGYKTYGDSVVIVLAATNKPWDLDKALTNRFSLMVYVPLPDFPARKSLFVSKLSSLPGAASLDFDILAQKTSGFSGREIVGKIINDMQVSAWKRNQSGEEDAPLLMSDAILAISSCKPTTTSAEIERFEQFEAPQ
jgi:SpoVK/Ycf46/Vps4 family AAA+-type ATPase